MTGFNVKLDQNGIEANNSIDGVFANATDGFAGTIPNSPSVFYNYAEKNSVELIPHGLIGSQMFSGAVLSAYQKIYFIPCSADYVAIYDVMSKTISTPPSLSGLPGTSLKWWGATLYTDDKIYCCPYNDNNILVIDTKTDTYELIPVVPGTAKWKGCCVDPITKQIVFAPFASDSIALLDPKTKNITYILKPGVSSGSYAAIVSAQNGKLYLIPAGERHVLIFDTVTQTYDNITISGFSGAGSKWRGASYAINNKIYCCNQNETRALIINTTINSWAYSAVMPVNIKYFGTCATPDGSVYFCPNVFSTVPVFDISTDTYTTTSASTGDFGWSGFCFDGIGNVIGVPWNSGFVMRIPTGIPTFNIDWHTSLYRNKL